MSDITIDLLAEAVRKALAGLPDEFWESASDEEIEKEMRENLPRELEALGLKVVRDGL